MHHWKQSFILTGNCTTKYISDLLFTFPHFWRYWVLQTLLLPPARNSCSLLSFSTPFIKGCLFYSDFPRAVWQIKIISCSGKRTAHSRTWLACSLYPVSHVYVLNRVVISLIMMLKLLSCISDMVITVSMHLAHSVTSSKTHSLSIRLENFRAS